MFDRPGKYSAAGSAAGYLFQCRYALFAALRYAYRNTGIELSIEKFDDVAFESGGNPLDLIQTKHHISRSGSLSDTSPDLWKTIRIWSDAVMQDPSLLRRTRFLLITTSSAPDNSIAALMRPGDGRADDTARERLAVIAEAAQNVANRPAYATFLGLSEAAQVALVKCISVVDAAPDLLETEGQIIASVRMAAPRDKQQVLAERLEGWWWGRICRALMQPDASVITIAEVEGKIDELREEFRRDALPLHYCDAEPPEQEAATYDRRPFVRQLRLVGIKGRRVEFAKRDFYRAYEQRSRWTREKLLFDDEITAYERRLLEEWEVRFEAMCDGLCGCNDEARFVQEGQNLLRWVEQEARLPLRSVIERFLTVGSYHILADRLRIGWHIDYLNRTKHDEEDTTDG